MAPVPLPHPIVLQASCTATSSSPIIAMLALAAELYFKGVVNDAQGTPLHSGKLSLMAHIILHPGIFAIKLIGTHLPYLLLFPQWYYYCVFRCCCNTYHMHTYPRHGCLAPHPFLSRVYLIVSAP